MLENIRRLIVAEAEVEPPEDFGEGVVFFGVIDFGQFLADYKRAHPSKMVTAIVPLFRDHNRVMLYGYFVNFEDKQK